MKAISLSLGLLLLAAVAGFLPAEEKPDPAKLDVTKTLVIERPVEDVLAGTGAVPPALARATGGESLSRAIVTPDDAARQMVAAQMARLADRGKGEIELPLKEAIAGPVPASQSAEDVNSANGVTLHGAGAPPATVANPRAEAEGFVNPKVEPGKVRWHADLAAACAAAEQSGKPVLLFQMMGKLDDRFC